MSKVIKHTRNKISAVKSGKVVRTKHNHLTLSKTGYIPGGTNYAVNIKIAKRG